MKGLPGKRLMLLKLIYFCSQASLSCILPYATLYAFHLGLTPSQVGLIWGLEPLISFLCSPLWGSIADKYSKHKQIYMTCIVCSTALYVSLLFVPPTNLSSGTEGINATNAVNCTAMLNADVKSCPVPKIGKADGAHNEYCITMCNSNEINTMNFSSIVCDDVGSLVSCNICSGNEFHKQNVQNYSETASNGSLVLPLPARFVCDNWPIGSCDELKCCNCDEVLSADVKDSGNPMLTFGLCICVVLTGTVFQSVIMPFVDALCFGILAERGGGDYGRQRLWGAVGWGIFAFVSGIVVDEYNQKLNSDRTHYDPIFYMLTGFAILTFLCTAFIKFPTHKSAEHLGKNLWLVLKKAYIVAYFIVVGIMGIGFGVSGAFLFLFMDELNSTYLVMGLSQMVTTLAEIPCFFVSGPIIKRIGHNGAFCLAFLAFFVRFLGYSFASNPWVILPFQVLHGLTFGLFWAAATSYATMIAPKGMIATLQTICAGVHFGIGKGVGVALGGLIYEQLGSRNLFRACAGLNVLAFVAYYLFLCYMGLELTKPPSDAKDPNQIDQKPEKTEKDDPEADVALQEMQV